MMNLAVIGAGTVGSCLADTCTRTGDFQVTSVVDNDFVEAKNISKSIYRWSHVERLKVECLSEHLYELTDSTMPMQFPKLAQDLTDEEWTTIFDRADMVLDACDSKTGISETVRRLTAYYKASGKDILLLKSFCLDNAAAGVVIVWSPGSDLPCPACLVQSVPYLNDASERGANTDPDYHYDRLTGSPVRGVLPDVIYGIALASSLMQAIAKTMDGRPSGRENLLRTVAERNIFIWSSFRDPYLDWQTVEVMGTANPLDFSTPSPCIDCGMNVESGFTASEGTDAQTAPRFLSIEDISPNCFGDDQDDRYYRRQG